jgi:preprotein translocase subunit SecY
MLRAISNAWKLPDLRRKLIITLIILVIFRLAAHVPVPGILPEELSKIFASNQLLGLLNMFSGGAMASFSVMAMGVYPYITASIIMQLLQPLIPALEELSKEGEAGQNKLNQYMLLVTIPLAALQGFSQATLLQRAGALQNFGLARATLLPTLATLATLTAGTMFAIWLGELIDEEGIGNGISLIIFSGIVAEIPSRVGSLILSNVPGLLFFVAVTLVTIVVIIFIQEGQRRIPVQYAKRVRGTKVYGGASTHIPLRRLDHDVARCGVQLPCGLQSDLGGKHRPVRLQGVRFDGGHLLGSVLSVGHRVHLFLYRYDVSAAESCRDAATAGRLCPGYSAG